MSAARDLDVVLYGATGFVGRLTARYLAEHAPEGARIGLGGRTEAKLAQVRGELGPRAADWPLLVADSGDAAGLADVFRAASSLSQDELDELGKRGHVFYQERLSSHFGAEMLAGALASALKVQEEDDSRA